MYRVKGSNEYINISSLKEKKQKLYNMNENLLSAITGTVCTTIYSIITLGELWKIALFGLIGGATGYLGKILIKKLFEKLKIIKS